MFLAWIVERYSKEKMHTRSTEKWSILNSFELNIHSEIKMLCNLAWTLLPTCSWVRIVTIMVSRPGFVCCVGSTPVTWPMARDTKSLSIWKLMKMYYVQFVIKGLEGNSIWTDIWNLCTVNNIVVKITTINNIKTWIVQHNTVFWNIIFTYFLKYWSIEYGLNFYYEEVCGHCYLNFSALFNQPIYLSMIIKSYLFSVSLEVSTILFNNFE